jgi:succinate dehydrogenase / fumarate reductase, cytochrome b subunit
MAQTRPQQNYLGIWGWVYGGRYQMERYLYILHRVTGLGLLLFMLFHFTATTVFRVQGEAVWGAAMSLLHNPWFKMGEYLVVVAFVFHTFNGARLILQELGFILGKPVPPIFPYKDSIRKKRPWTIVLLAVIVILCIAFFYDFIMGGW